MSGLFKNLEKVINQQVFTTKNHGYLLTQGCHRFWAGAYYFDPATLT